MSDGKVKIDTEINTSGIQKGINNITNKLNKLADNKTLTAFSKLGNAVTGLSSAFGIAGKAVSVVSDTLKEATQAFEVQRTAEVQLETAAKNNPYLNDSNVDQLKAYASQLQSISTVGDEELLPFMAQLASSGRTQSQIMEIMSASLDIAASGTMSIDSAVRNLNKTFGGLSGELGEAFPQIKALTQEELKQGKAVEILKQSYKGMSKTIANELGGKQQLANSIGDLKEKIGEPIQEIENGMAKAATRFVDKINEGLDNIKKGWNEFLKNMGDKTENKDSGLTLDEQINTAKAEMESQKAYYDSLKKNYEDARKWLEENQAPSNYNYKAQYNGETGRYIEKGLNNTNYDVTDTISAEQKEWDKIAYNATKAAKSIDEVNTAEKIYNNLKKEYERLNTQKEVQEETAQKQAEAETEQKVNDILKKNHEARQVELDAIQRKYDMMVAEGQEIDATAKKQEELNVYEKYYQQLISTDRDLLTEKNSRAKADLEDLKTKYKEILDLIANGTDSSSGSDINLNDKSKRLAELDAKLFDDSVVESKIAAFDRLRDEYMVLYEDLYSTDEDYQQKKTELEEQFAEKRKSVAFDEALEIASYVEEQVNTLTSAFSEAASLYTDTIDNQTSAETTHLETMYKEGLISEQAYYAQKEKLEKQGAQKKYKVELAEWAMNLLATQSANALAIAKALTTGTYPLNLINAAVTGASAAVQLASQIAAKPVPPSYATGGIVGGTSYTGDKVQANLNSREMILNNGQQRNLFDAINSGNLGNGAGVTNQITVNNSASDVANASATVTQNGIVIAVKKIVSDGLADGSFNTSYQQMQANIYGKRITN